MTVRTVRCWNTEPGFPWRKPMSTNNRLTQEGTATELTDFDARPENCDCAGWSVNFPCWPCYRDGFDDPNPNASED